MTTVLRAVDINYPNPLPNPFFDYAGVRTVLSFNYNLTGTDGQDVIRGYVGHDVFAGGNGADTLSAVQTVVVSRAGQPVSAALAVEFVIARWRKHSVRCPLKCIVALFTLE